MGCNATSIYGDQVIGKIYYPDEILNDLRRRDFCKPFQIKDKKTLKEVSHKIASIYGFKQSFCQGFFFSTLIDQNQFLVYNNARFIIKTPQSELFNLQSGNKQPQMSILTHQDEICAMDVNQNMCAVGLSGGKLMLWDLKFDEMKIQIYLPKPSSSFSSISLTKKYIFATDTTLPNNIAYCFDIQTTKLKASILIESLEPTLKGIRYEENHHVIISAEGLWFMRYSVAGKALQLTKGMFTTFPKTSQCSLIVINDKYLVSGGVDGYIYLWNSQYKCIKVIKCFEKQSPITAITYSKAHNTLILGSMSGKVKCFSFSIKLKQKKNMFQPVQNDQAQMEEDIEYLLTEAFDQDFGIQNIIVSKQDALLYFVSHCRGSIMSHLLPSTDPYPAKIKSLNNQELMRFSWKGDALFGQDLKNQEQNAQKGLELINAYPSKLDEFKVDTLRVSTEKKWLKVEAKQVIDTNEINRNYLNFYSYCKTNNSIAYISQKSVLVDFEPLKKEGLTIREQLEVAQKQASLAKHLEIIQLSPQNVLVSQNYLEVQTPQKIFFFVTFEDQCNVFEVKNKRQYLLHTNIKFIKNKFNSFTIRYQLSGPNQEPMKENLGVSSDPLKDNRIQDPLKQNLKPNSDALKDNPVKEICLEVEFDEDLKVWKLLESIDEKSIKAQIVQKNQEQTNEVGSQDNWGQILGKVHCSYVKTMYETEDTKVTVGGSSIIFWDVGKKKGKQFDIWKAN